MQEYDTATKRDTTSTAEPHYRGLRPGPGLDAPAVEADQRERIQRAMVDLVAEDGYESVTVRRLAKLARVSTGTIYAHFGGKEECFISTYTAVTDGIHNRLIVSRSPRADLVDQLGLTIQALLDSLAPTAKTTRLALVEAFNGGPAALERIRMQEERLGEGIRVALERRQRAALPREICRWIAAGCLRIARAAAMADSAQPRQLVDELTVWAAGYLDGSAHGLAEYDQSLGRKMSCGGRSTLGTELGRGDNAFEESNLILAATLRLAASDGYWRLSMPAVRAATGLSRARFNRHFHTVDECYLTAIQTLSRRYARRMAGGREQSSWSGAVCRDVTELCAAIVANADLAKLVFVEVLAPGTVGMHRREEMIGEFAAVWRAGAPKRGRPSQAIAEATMAALWATIASRLERGEADRLPMEAATLSLLMLAPGREAAETVAP